MYAKMKEVGPIGEGRARCILDPPLVLHLKLVGEFNVEFGGLKGA